MSDYLIEQARALGEQRMRHRAERRELQASTRRLAFALREEGHLVVDIAFLMGVTPARISQILHEEDR